MEKVCAACVANQIGWLLLLALLDAAGQTWLCSMAHNQQSSKAKQKKKMQKSTTGMTSPNFSMRAALGRHSAKSSTAQHTAHNIQIESKIEETNIQIRVK